MDKTVAAVITVIVIAGAGLAGYYVADSRRADSVPRVETPTEVTEIAFSLPDIDGQIRDASEWAGKARLINFWATWCAPCRREIPLLKKTQAAHAEDNFQIIGIAVDFPEEVAAYAEEAQFNYPVLVGQEDAMAIAEASDIDFIGMPFTMVVAPSGELIKAHLGEIVESHIEQILDVFEGLQTGRLDIDGAREALGNL